VDDFAPRLSFFFNSHLVFLEESQVPGGARLRAKS
jgi:methylmalonyl-CoA mutase N-terminal domain/subunit